MDRKPWQGNGARRSFDDRRDRSDRFDRFDRSDRNDFRSDRNDRFGRFERTDRSERSDRTERFGRFERDERRFDRSERPARAEGGRRPFDDRRGGDFRKRGPGFGKERPDFGTRSGPRARAFETRRFAERSDFAKQGVVKLDSDIADFFTSAEDVNKFLRLVLTASEIVRKPKAAVAEEVVTPETAATLFAESDLEDDEDSDYGEGAEDTDPTDSEASDAEEPKSEKTE